MKAQEVVTLICEIPSRQDEPSPITYPELDVFFKDGMYVENFNQTRLSDGKYLLTFIFRRYNLAQSKQER